MRSSSRVVPAGMPAAASCSAPIGPGPSIAATHAGPISASSDMASTVAAPGMKWAGGSTWVPACVLRLRRETKEGGSALASCSAVASRSETTSTAGSPGQTGVRAERVWLISKICLLMLCPGF
ncbi:MAG: hypothetical protein BWY52_02938 [Chloroflexi bacterium ADurb.Bin325]|nr:MAG: hypothetical protein BWY52_02938 [Chloroflexi bacterium ADurb.Bin325]